MAIVLDPTVGGASANSYVDAGGAIAYFTSRTNATAIAGLTGDPLAQLLITAALRIDAENYRGMPTNATQAMKWPRVGVWHDGRAVASDTIPTAVKYAQCEMALAIQAAGMSDLLGPTGTETLDRVRAGSVEVQFRNPTLESAAQGTGGNFNPQAPVPAWDPSLTLPPQVFRLLRNWIITPQARRRPGFLKLARGG